MTVVPEKKEMNMLIPIITLAVWLKACSRLQKSSKSELGSIAEPETEIRDKKG